MKYLALLRKAGVYLFPVSALVFVHGNCLSDYIVDIVDAIPANERQGGVIIAMSSKGIIEHQRIAKKRAILGKSKADLESADKMFVGGSVGEGGIIQGGNDYDVLGIVDVEGNEATEETIRNGVRLLVYVKGIGQIALESDGKNYYVEPAEGAFGSAFEGANRMIGSMWRGVRYATGAIDDEEYAKEYQEEEKRIRRDKQVPEFHIASPSSWFETAGNVIVWFVMINLIIACWRYVMFFYGKKQ